MPRRSSRSKCFTQTAPAGRLHGPAAEKPNVEELSGSANHRVLRAWSDQKETFVAYGTTPGAGVSVATLVNTPVSARVAGRGVPLALGFGTSRLITLLS